MSPSKTLFYLCVSFIVGIFLASILKIQQSILWIFLFVSVFAMVVSLFYLYHSDAIRRLVSLLGFCVLLVIVGILRFQISEFNIANNKLAKLNGQGGIVLTGIISNEPDVRDTSQKLKVKIGDSTILVTTNRYPEYKYLDEVKITGKLETPFETEDFSYKNYLMKDHIYSVMSFPKIELVGKSSGDPLSAVYSGILFFKQKMRRSIQNNFLPPQSSVLQGIILGDKGAVPQDIKDKFKITGLSHLIAVSGMHVVILSSIVMAVLLFLGLWRQQAFWAAVVFIFIYVILVGAPASAIRAGIMALIYLSAQALGRQTMSSRIIVLAAALMLLFNPLLLIYDIGFQLSFLAVLGLAYFEPLLRGFIKFVMSEFTRVKIEQKYDNAIMIFTVTISAQIFTLPIVIYNFGTISLISPVTNILILPIIYYLMLFGFLSSLVGMIWVGLGWLISLPCYFLMTYFLWVIDFFAKPWAYKTISGVSWIWLLLSYFVLGFFTRFLRRKFSRNFI